MKPWTILTVLIVFTGLFARAGELNWPNVQNTVFTNNLVSTNIVATTIQTNAFSSYKSINHTFEMDWSAMGTNDCTNYLDASVSGNQWFNLYTFGSNASYSVECQVTGEWCQFREREVMESTNGTMNIYYAGH